VWPDRANPPSVGSFPSPVDPPTTEPDASPNVAVTINCEWLPYIRGALQQLLLQATWKGDAAAVLLAQQRSFNLIDLFQECGGSVLPFACPYNYFLSNGGWSTVDGRGTWIPLVGWRDTFDCTGGNGERVVFIHKSFSPAVNINHIVMTYNLFKGSIIAGSWQSGFVGQYLGSNVIVNLVNAITDADGVNKTLTFTGGPQLVDNILMAVTVGQVIGCSDPGGQAEVVNLEVEGVGTAAC